MCDVDTGNCNPGTDVNDCSSGAPMAAPMGEPSTEPTNSTCAYENDGECDVPSYCPEGTDVNDCFCPTENDASLQAWHFKIQVQDSSNYRDEKISFLEND